MTATAPSDLETAAPQPPTARILGYDLARALAVCGMVLVHFALVMGGAEPKSGWPALALHALDGRPAALFVLLAGVGVTLRAARAEGPAALARQRRVLTRRGLVLLAVGFVNLTIWSGDILRVYGVSLMLTAGLLRASDRTLLTLAAAFVVAFIALFLTVDYDVHWDWNTLTYHGLWTPAGALRNLFYDGFRAIFPWTGLLIFGMWLGRRDVASPATRRRLFVWGAGVAIGAEVLSAIGVHVWLAHPGRLDPPTIRALAGTESMPPLPAFLLAAGGAAVAVMALSLTVTARRPDALPVRALVATGQMAFTWYVTHIILGLGFVIAMGWDRAASTRAGLAAGLGFYLIAVAISLLHKRVCRHGPLEWLLRKIAG